MDKNTAQILEEAQKNGTLEEREITKSEYEQRMKEQQRLATVKELKKMQTQARKNLSDYSRNELERICVNLATENGMIKNKLQQVQPVLERVNTKGVRGWLIRLLL